MGGSIYRPPTLELISSSRITAPVATVDFDNAAWFDGRYKGLHLIAREVIPATDNQPLNLQFKIDGAWKITLYNGHIGILQQIVSTYAGSGYVNRFGIIIGLGLGNDGADNFPAFDADLFIYPNVKATRRKSISGMYTMYTNANVFDGGPVMGGWDGSGTALEGLRFSASAGNLNNGDFSLYGVRG